MADCVGRGGSIQLGWAGARSGTASQLAATPTVRELIDTAPRTLQSINQSINRSLLIFACLFVFSASMDRGATFEVSTRHQACGRDHDHDTIARTQQHALAAVERVVVPDLLLLVRE